MDLMPDPKAKTEMNSASLHFIPTKQRPKNASKSSFSEVELLRYFKSLCNKCFDLPVI